MRLRHSRGALSVALFCGLAHGQTLATQHDKSNVLAHPEIQGTVLESGTTQPLVGAEVSLYFLGEERPSIRYGIGSLTSTNTAQTDAAGAFAFYPEKLGYYTVSAKKEGYSAPSRGEGKSIIDVTLTTAEPAGEARLRLSRPGQVTGAVVDMVTGKPIPNLTVYATRITRQDGRILVVAAVQAKTNADGEFVVSNLTPGEYLVNILAQKTGRERIISGASADDWRAVDEDYEASYWPGGHDLETAVPLVVGSGLSVDAGKVHVHKVPYYRLHVRIPPGSCGPGDKMLIYQQVPRRTSIIGSAACAPDLLITGFPPGSYRLLLTMIKDAAETRETASVSFVVQDKNVEITAPLERGVTVNVTVAAFEEAKTPDFGKLRVTLNPLNALPTGDLVTPRPVNPSGKAQFVGFPLGGYLVTVGGLGAGAYVKEFRYNGHPLPDQILPLGAAMGQDLTILIDDKVATISGVVMDGDQPVSEPHVILAKWPLPGGDYPDPPVRTAGDKKGRFGFTGLAPGEYRVLAVRSREEDDDRLPGTLERALEAAKKVEVGPNAVQNVTIDVIKLR